MTTFTRLGLRAFLAALLALGGALWNTADAQLTPAGVTIQNRATISYSVGGTAQTPIESSPTGNTVPGAADLLAGKMPGYGYDAQELWKHSLSVAFASKLIAAIKNKDLIYEAHTAGLIHDVGKIILDRYIMEQKDKIADYMDQEEKTFLDAERYFFGFDHAEIASEICRSWKIPENITLSIGCHHQPSISNGDELSYMLHIADYVATMGGIGYDDDDILYEAEKGAMDFIGLTQEEIGGMIPKVIEAVEQF